MKNGNSIYYSYDALGRKHSKRMVTLKAAFNLVMENAYAEVDRGGVQYTPTIILRAFSTVVTD